MAAKVSFLTKMFKPVVSFRTTAFGVGGALGLLGTLYPCPTQATDTPAPRTKSPSSKKEKSTDLPLGSAANAEQHKANHQAVVDALKAEKAAEAENEEETEEAIDLTKEIASGKSMPSRHTDDEEDDNGDKASTQPKNETFDMKAANTAMETVEEERMPDERSSEENDNAYVPPKKKHGLAGFFSDSSVSDSKSTAPKSPPEEKSNATFTNTVDGEDNGVGIQKEVVPVRSFESSNGTSAAPTLNTPATTTSSSNIQGFNNEAVPDIFEDDNTPQSHKDPVTNWLGDEGGSPDSEGTRNAWLHSLVPTKTKATDSSINDSNVIDWGSYETSGQAPALALEAPLKPGDNSLPLYRPEAIFLDPFGANSWLRKHGLAFTLDNQNEFAGAITKATKGYKNLKQGSGNAGSYGFEADVDWEKLAGIKGLQTHTLLVGRYGIPGSRSFGENLNNSSQIYGGGGNVAVHLAYTYAEESIFSNRLRIAAGRMPLMTFFAKNPLECTFMSNAFCGNPKPGNDVYTRVSNPGANWAAKVVYYPTEHTYIQAGLYFPENYSTNRSGFKFSGSRIHGQSFPVEFGWLPSWGAYKGHYKAGVVADDSGHQQGTKFSPETRPRNPNDPFYKAGYPLKRGHGTWGAWFVFDQVLIPYKTPANLSAGLVLMGGVWFNDPTYAERQYEFQIGLLDTGFWKSRPLDSLGINFAYTSISNWVRKYERAQIHNGFLPQNCSMSGGSLTMRDGDHGGVCGVQTNSAVLEVMYKIHVTRGVYVSPDFQYFFNPGGQHNLRDAAMFGVKSHVQLF